MMMIVMMIMMRKMMRTRMMRRMRRSSETLQKQTMVNYFLTLKWLFSKVKLGQFYLWRPPVVPMQSWSPSRDLLDVRSSAGKQMLQRGKHEHQMMGPTLKQSKIRVSGGKNLVFFSHIPVVYLPDAPLSTSTCVRNIVGLFVRGQNTSVPSAGSVSSWVSEPQPQKHQQLSTLLLSPNSFTPAQNYHHIEADWSNLTSKWDVLGVLQLFDYRNLWGWEQDSDGHDVLGT